MREMIDNRSLHSKVKLRRYLLERLGWTDDVRVLDACTGKGLIWTEMEQHVTIKRWTRCDIKPEPGAENGTVLRLSAVQSLSNMDLADFNVIDIDTYGEPWSAYHVLLQRFTTPMAVFLTYGRMVSGRGASDWLKEAVGIPRDWNIPRVPQVTDFIGETFLKRTWEYADITHSYINYSHPGHARSAVSYYALALTPR